ncbi:MAG: hypothetical protein GXO36_00180 [Chloroflexi bacterium]|nr:hypothetical protein [Chloroflexota bacterium]
MAKETQALPAGPEVTKAPSGRWKWYGLAGVIALLLLCGGVTWWLMLPTTPTARIRDIVIIFLALVGFLTSVALVILLAQLAVLIHMLHEELKPILHSTQETVSTVQGTVNFVSKHVAEPVIKMSKYVAMARAVATVLRTRPRRR